MRRVFVLLAASAFGVAATVVDSPGVLAGDRAFSDESGVKRAGNWSKKASDAKKPTETDTSTASDIPVPRPKPGSKAAKADAARAKTAEKETKKAPVPRKKTKPKADVQAGLTPSDNGSGNTSAPYRGSLDSTEIKEALTGKVLASRIDGKRATITLGEEGVLNWKTASSSGQGRWWVEKGRICDRYDPSGDFPGRGAGCRSFEQKSDGFYAGGRKLQFVN
ncbi:hypothetical protein [Anderseniella sp. Alg231-50]|uniref:hypothetical protein n=1 Tax=Anderseniella sp. Alg231-50 TaxID=1922226 RepID=UPI000D5526FA